MRRIVSLGLLIAVAACVPAQPPPAAPLPPPAPAPTPPAPPPAPPPTEWQDAPLSPGDWSYRADGGRASAVFAAAPGTFVLRCEGNGSLTLDLAGGTGPGIIVRTTFGERRVPGSASTTGMAVTLAASDPLLDQIVFSRGRFMVQAGSTALILPAWPEPARVIEECRA